MQLGRIAAAVAVAAFALALASLALPYIGWAMFGGLSRVAVDLTFGFTAGFGGLVYVGALIAAMWGFGVELPLPARLTALRARFV